MSSAEKQGPHTASTHPLSHVLVVGRSKRHRAPAPAATAVVMMLMAFFSAAGSQAAPAARPNILWITCEDSSPHLGSYGDPLAVTPHLDALAREGVRYTQAFAYTGVCAPSRSCLITGVNPLRLGSHHMRSTTRLPEEVKCFPEYLRAAGYHTTNNVKTDYNFPVPPGAWNENSKEAHWRSRRPGQPFFAVFNFTITHQSQIFGPDMKAGQAGEPPPPTRHDPTAVSVPPIHPDTPEFRREWARHFDNVTTMDGQAGALLRQLEEDGLVEDTIVFFFSDHGTGMPSVKMWAWDASLRVPLIIRFPDKWRRFAPAPPGGTTDRLVTFVDFAPTVLSLAGLDAPGHFQGSAFLGESMNTPRRYVHGGKDRQGEAYDCVRSVHDGRFHYLRNFLPHLPYGQYMSYQYQHASMRVWQKLHDEGKLQGPAARFFQAKPVEELYDVTVDPWETRNLADDPRHRETLERMRYECRDWMLRTGDLGLLPEHEIHQRADGSTPWAVAIDPEKNPLPALLRAADVANQRDVANLKKLELYLQHPDSALRWWGATGLFALGTQARIAEPALRKAIADSSPVVRIAAAEALAALGHDRDALTVFTSALENDSALVRLAALNALHRMGARARPAIDAIKQAGRRDPQHVAASDYVARMVDYLPSQLEE